jgi:NAD(P)H-hydrate epimerase
MKIFSAEQIKAWDAYTIEKEPVSSFDLMNRASQTFVNWLTQQYPDSSRKILVIAGTGNNGGDGLATARMLDQAQYPAKVVVCDFGTAHSEDFQKQDAAISSHSPVKPRFAFNFEAFQEMVQAEPKNTLIIDALFGTGLNRPLDSDWAKVIQWLNQKKYEMVSIDLPSGLFADNLPPNPMAIHAKQTFSFQCPKLAFFLPENDEYVGEWQIGDIDLHPKYEKTTPTPFHFLIANEAAAMLKKRRKFSHKGNFGHVLLVAGSWGKMGAAILASRACLRAGAGLLTVHTPRCGNHILQNSVPEAMTSADRKAKYWTELPDLSPFSSIGIGPGIGKMPETAEVLMQLLTTVRVPLVLDADALNILAENPSLFGKLPADTVLTPHPKEFERLFGRTANSLQRIELQREKAQQHQLVIVLKGAYSTIATPDGECWFNSSGNPGMATGGSGDVLTGIITALLAQGYSSKEAALLGVYLHGLSGDIAAQKRSEEAMIAGDLIEYLGAAYLNMWALKHDSSRILKREPFSHQNLG